MTILRSESRRSRSWARNLRSALLIGSAYWLMAIATGTAEELGPDCRLTNAWAREVTNTVYLKKAVDARERLAKKGDEMQGEDILRTGSRGSMAELQFDNGSVARLGSQSAFTFLADRNHLKLENGLALFSSHKGCVVTCETCSLSITQGSTSIVETFLVKSPEGQSRSCATKYILLEGAATVAKPGSKQTRRLRGGQMIFQREDMPLAEPQEVDLKRLLKESRIVTGFKTTLPNMAGIQQVVEQQQRDLWRGTLEVTGFTVGGRGYDRYVESTLVQPDLEAPYDPDVTRAIFLTFVPNCPTCR